MTDRPDRSRTIASVAALATLSLGGIARAFPPPVQADPANQLTASIGANYGQVQSFSRKLNYDPANIFASYPKLYWFKYTSDGNTRVKFDTLGTQIQTGTPGGSVLGSSNSTQIAVYDLAGNKKAISKGTVGRDGNPIAMYPTYLPALKPDGSKPDAWYYSQGLSELYLQPGATDSPRWHTNPNDPMPYTGWNAPENGPGQQYFRGPNGETNYPYYYTDLNEYQVWNTSLSKVVLDSNGNPVINPNTSQPFNQPFYRYGDRARIGPGASWNNYDVLPAGDYYLAVSSTSPTFAGDTYSEEYLRFPVHFDYDTLTNGNPILTAPLGPFQYYQPPSQNDFYGDLNLNVTTLPVADPTWQTNADGNWSVQGNWSAAIPTVSGAVAKFASAITSPKTVTVDGDRIVGTIKFDSANRYTLAGTGKITVEGWFNEALITVTTGSHTINAPLLMNSATSTVDVQQASSTLTIANYLPTLRPLTKVGAGKLEINTINSPSFAVQAGTLKLTTPAVAGKVTSMSISSSGTLDLGPSALVLDYSAATSPLETIRLMLAAGRITSSSPNLRVGYGEASTLGKTSFLGQGGLDATALLLRATRAGDADLSGTVDFDDLLALAKNYNAASGANWTRGDFDYDADVDFDDLLLVAKNYNLSAAAMASAGIGDAAFQADWALASALAPEPTSIALIGGAVALLRRRRR